MLNAYAKYGSLKSVIDRCDAAVLETLNSSNIREARIAAESFKNGGKRLRPALMILSSLAPNGSGGFESVPDSLIDLAAAVELIHLATLFHDDVIDEVDSRRDSVSARAKYGNYATVLAGDYVLAEALLLVERAGLERSMPEFLRTIRVLVRGESHETSHKFNFDMSEATYYEIISEKSASLFSLACKIGGLSTHVEYADFLGHFGWNLGMAFQMIDDLDDMLDLPNGNMDCDLKNGYLSLPVIHALGALHDGHRDKLIRLIREGDFTASEEREIASICNDQAGIEYAHGEIQKHLDGAETALTRFDGSAAAGMLRMVVEDLKGYARAQLEELRNFTGTPA